MWEYWKQKNIEFQRWIAPSFALKYYWRFLSNQLLNRIQFSYVLLDVGCGYGLFTGILETSGKCMCAISVDPNIDHLKSSQATHKIGAVGEYLPLKNGVVDGVILKSVLDHVADPQKVLVEASRVASNVYILQGITQDTKPTDTHTVTFTAKKLQLLLRIAGWKMLRNKTFYSMRFKQVLMLIPWLYNFLGLFFGYPSSQLIHAHK